MTAQKSCFTVHGKLKQGLHSLLAKKDIRERLSGREILKKYIIDPDESKVMLEKLRTLGICEATLFPDLDGLAKDLTRLFRPDLGEVEEMKA